MENKMKSTLLEGLPALHLELAESQIDTLCTCWTA